MVKQGLLSFYFRHNRGAVLLASLFSVLNKLFDLAPPFLIGAAVDIAVRQEESFLASFGISSITGQFVVLGGVTFFIWVMESLFEYLYKLKWGALAQKIQHDLRHKGYGHIQKLEMAFFEDQQTGRIMSVLNNDINQMERFLNDGINEILQLAVTVTVITISFFVIAADIAWMAMVPIPFLVAFSIGYQRFLKPRYRSVRERVGIINGLLSNNLTGIDTIKSFVTEDYEQKRIDDSSLEYAKANLRALGVSAGFVPLIRMIIVVGFTLILIFGGLKTLDGGFPVAAYSAMIFLTQRLLWPLTRLGQTLDLFQRSMASVHRVEDILSRKPEIVDGSDSLNVQDVEGRIEFRNIHFSYPTREGILRNFSTMVEPGQNVAFVGATGSGKSTLVKLLLRFYDPLEGAILLDGKDTKDYPLKDLRQAIGLVKQDTFIIDGTVRENIAYGLPHVGLEEVRRAARIAEIDDFVQSLPLQYETPVGERGQKLSGGQRQRIAIARAVLKNPPILILDEATSSVDNETEAAIQRSLEKIIKGRTTIIIAHRLSTIRDAHRIIVIGDGGILEEGTHDQLIKQSGPYARLWEVQTGEQLHKHIRMDA